MSKRISKFITIMLVAAMMLSCFSTYNASTNVYAAKRTTATKNIKQNNKKNKVKWKLKKGVLTIYGKGKMPESVHLMPENIVESKESNYQRKV